MQADDPHIVLDLEYFHNNIIAIEEGIGSNMVIGVIEQKM